MPVPYALPFFSALFYSPPVQSHHPLLPRHLRPPGPLLLAQLCRRPSPLHLPRRQHITLRACCCPVNCVQMTWLSMRRGTCSYATSMVAQSDDSTLVDLFPFSTVA